MVQLADYSLEGIKALQACNRLWEGIPYRLLYGRGVPLGHISSGVAISARGL